MSLATMNAPTNRLKAARTRKPTARLILVIGGRAFRLWPHIDDPSTAWEWKHVLQGPDGRPFGVYEAELDRIEAMNLLMSDDPIPRKYVCEACGPGHCSHVDALVELGLL